MLKETKKMESLEELLENVKKGADESMEAYKKEPEPTKAWGYRVKYKLYKEIQEYVTDILNKEETK